MFALFPTETHKLAPTGTHALPPRTSVDLRKTSLSGGALAFVAALPSLRYLYAPAIDRIPAGTSSMAWGWG